MFKINFPPVSYPTSEFTPMTFSRQGSGRATFPHTLILFLKFLQTELEVCVLLGVFLASRQAQLCLSGHCFTFFISFNSCFNGQGQTAFSCSWYSFSFLYYCGQMGVGLVLLKRNPTVHICQTKRLPELTLCILFLFYVSICTMLMTDHHANSASTVGMNYARKDRLGSPRV